MLRGTPGPTWTPGRRGALIGASAAAVCLGAVLAACGGGGGGGGYVATGAVGGASSGTAMTPTGRVTLVPLDGPREASGSPSAAGRDAPAAHVTSPGATAPAPGPSASPARDEAGSDPTTATPPSPAAPSSSAGPARPADLTWSDPVREATGERWCEDVTLTLTNSGGTAVRSGTVTFGTHVIGALGVDWGTVTSDAALPAPIGAGVREAKTWTVCVDAWRVPLGMHIETRDVTVRWK
ncbi:hypothetical protein [Streptomyces sp. CdTB01]|uniref:hypothetical protein n=1 Tax=Streptomyces sp. CdTB01 TaxID=1725411 RepID=UPI00073AE073|nr:hypothetical protein [Streptomyces sp. CdTB01]ALV34786.1 hypothetical protein AS200_24065 [Streptomyces sp. CdTB01]